MSLGIGGDGVSYREGETSSTILRGWRKIPLIVRAPVVGFAVMTLGVEVWRTLATLNIRILPEAPWASGTMLAFLALYWRYFSGRFWPRATAQTRRLSMRAHRLAPAARPWVLAAAIVGLAFTVSVHFLSLRFVDLPPDALSLIPRGVDLPWQTLWVSVLMISVVAGVCEEIGIRGYIQTPLESRYGVAAAVLISSTIFTLIHFNHQFGVALALPIFLSALWYGALTAAANSILPMVAIHVALDIVLISYHDVLQGPVPTPFRSTGHNDEFMLNATTVGVLAVVLAVLIFVVAVMTRRSQQNDDRR